MKFQSKWREFIALLGGTIAVCPLAARDQPAGTVWRIGFLTPRMRPSPPGPDAVSDAVIDGMSKLGYSEGKNLAITPALLGCAPVLYTARSVNHSKYLGPNKPKTPRRSLSGFQNPWFGTRGKPIQSCHLWRA
jgi:hypothetical protein